MYWVRGRTKTTFAAARVVSDADGYDLIAGRYYDHDTKTWTETARAGNEDAHGMAVTPVDWDADGDLDLVLGMTDGRVFLRRNEGTAEAPRFAVKNEKIKYGRRSVFVKSGDATPVAADWDGDGLFDLLSGSKAGAVFLWRNVGERGAPAFAPPVELVPDADSDAGIDQPGIRTQVHVADYDGDGDADLLVGDYQRREGEVHGWVWLFRRERVSTGPADR